MVKTWLFDLVPYPELAPPEAGSSADATVYAEHLDTWVQAEAFGFHGVFVGEHHFTPYSMLPSPNLIVAALARLTSTMRIGIMCNIASMHHPLRLAEEGAMLDLLADGRLEFGLGRGADKLEFDTVGIPMEETRPRLREAADLIVQGWTDARFDFKGDFYSVTDAAVFPRPIQQPHPRIWITATRTPETIEWAADNGFAISTIFHSVEDFKTIFEMFYERAEKSGKQVSADDVAFARSIYTADSHAQAFDEASAAWDFFVAQFRNTGAVAFTADAYKGWLEPFAGGRKPTFQELVDEGIVICGTPDEVTEVAVEQARGCGAGNFMAWSWFGSMTPEQVRHSHELLAAKMVPALASL